MKDNIMEKLTEQVGRSPKLTREKPPVYWHMDFNHYRIGGGFSCLNEDVLKRATGRIILGPPAGNRGFPDYPEIPKILFDKKLGKPPADLELFDQFWLISAKAKSVFESLDREAFAFFPCETIMPDGSDGPEYWLCDVLPVLDAVDEENSKMTVHIDKSEYKWYDWCGPHDIKIKSECVRGHKIFRLKYSQSRVICDKSVKLGCKGLTNIRFYPLNNII